MLKLNYFKEFQTLAEFLAQLYPKEAEIFRLQTVASEAKTVRNQTNALLLNQTKKSVT